jgi:hypothetical protein
MKRSAIMARNLTASVSGAVLPNGILIIAAAYTVLFSAIPEPVRLAIAGLTGIIIVVSAVFQMTTSGSMLSVYGYVTLLCAIAIAFIADVSRSRDPADYLTDTVRLLTGLAALSLFKESARSVSPRILVAAYAGVLVAAVLAYALNGTLTLAGIPRLYPFTGVTAATSADGIHSSAYTLTAALIGGSTLWRMGHIRNSSAVLLIVPLAVMVIANQVRTTWLMVVVFMVSIGMTHIRDERVRLGTITIVLITVVFGFLIAAIDPSMTRRVSEEEVSEFSSGRTDAYVERAELITGRSIMNIAFGTGPGSDHFSSTTWWWEEKNSHNTFFHFTVEAGVVGSCGLLMVLCAVLISTDRFQAPVVLAVIASSLVSNGVLERPLIAALHIAVVGVPRRMARSKGSVQTSPKRGRRPAPLRSLPAQGTSLSPDASKMASVSTNRDFAVSQAALPMRVGWAEAHGRGGDPTSD